MMWEIIKDTIIDTIKIVPFLFVAFLIIEIIEHKLSNKNKDVIKRSGKYGPVIGGILGIIPQCGFSTMATNLYVTRIVSLGTLVSIYLSCSDEMLPILLSEKVSMGVICKLLIMKAFIGIISGIVIDLILRKRSEREEFQYDICSSEHCHCEEENIITSSFYHTVKISIFILIINFLLNIVFNYGGESFLAKMLLNDNVFSSFLTGIIGLIPNCGASVMITELYINKVISLGATMSGLLAGSGISMFILFKTNKNIKENIGILLLVYGISVVSGMIIDLIGIVL